MMMTVLILASLLLAGLAHEGWADAAAGEGPRVGREEGEIYPPVVLPSLDGKRTLSLSEYAGKKVLLVQFASW